MKVTLYATSCMWYLKVPRHISLNSGNHVLKSVKRTIQHNKMYSTFANILNSAKIQDAKHVRWILSYCGRTAP